MDYKKGKIILVEDDKVDQEAFVRFAKRNDFPYEFVIAGSVAEVRNMPDLLNFDAAVIDYMLGDGNAFDLFNIMIDIPIVVVTGKGDEEIAVQAMKEGAYDYLVKDADGNYLKVLAVTVEKAIRKKQLENMVTKRTQQLNDANNELKRLATSDPLTGISNYRRFFDFLKKEWRRAIRNENPISIIMIDIDFFKNYNDMYGHQTGDDCLRKVAQTLEKIVNRPGDLAARYGGEEFIMILAETDLEGAGTVAERSRLKVEELRIKHESSSVAPHVTVSVGHATKIPLVGDDPTDLIKAADLALYKSKNEGRNRVNPSMKT